MCVTSVLMAPADTYMSARSFFYVGLALFNTRHMSLYVAFQTQLCCMANVVLSPRKVSLQLNDEDELRKATMDKSGLVNV